MVVEAEAVEVEAPMTTRATIAMVVVVVVVVIVVVAVAGIVVVTQGSFGESARADSSGHHHPTSHPSPGPTSLPTPAQPHLSAYPPSPPTPVWWSARRTARAFCGIGALACQRIWAIMAEGGPFGHPSQRRQRRGRRVARGWALARVLGAG